MAAVQTQATRETDGGRAVTLIDCDVHAQPTEAMLAQHLGPWARSHLEHHGRRTPRTTD